jgi:putative RNA 2'-phosphotransferase
VGFATLRAILKLWLGFSPSRSGIYSAGNGPAMRSALLGVFFAGDPERRWAYVRASTQCTHTDPLAESAAQAVAETAAWLVTESEDLGALCETLCACSTAAGWTDAMGTLFEALAGSAKVSDFALALGAGAGVSGYCLKSVPVAIYAALRHRHDFRTAISEAISCGGDTDTVAAITGALVGAHVGPDGLPEEWLRGLRDWPLSRPVLQALGEKLARQETASQPAGPIAFCRAAVPVRNFFFLLAVLMHGFRRLLPPYSKFLAMNEKDKTRTSKFLSLVLRHEPEKIGLQLDAAGWVEVEVLLTALARHGKPLNRPGLETIVATSEKKRFAFSEDGRRIRASQGHSVEVELGYSAQTPPDRLYHGTATRFLEAIRREGLIKGERHHVHLSREQETARQVGMRHGKPAILIVDSAAMHASGHAFFLSENGVWLTAHVPAEFLQFEGEASL